MTFLESTLIGCSVLVAGIPAAVRYKKVDPAFYPFIYCLWLAGVNALVLAVMGYSGYYTSLNNNLYVLFEAWFYLLFFRNMGIFTSNQSLRYFLNLLIIISWVTDNLILGNINFVSSYYRVIYSFILVLLSISQINRLLINRINDAEFRLNSNILCNPLFLICIATIIFFTFKVLVEIFWLYGLNSSKIFRTGVYDILRYIDVFTNLIFALAILWIPPKREYILLS